MFKKNNLQNIILTVTATVVLIIITTGITFAVLTDFFSIDRNVIIGEIEVGLYGDEAGSNLISGYEDEDGSYILGSPISVSLSDTIGSPTNLNLWLKNSGNIDGLARASVTINLAPQGDETVGKIVSELQVTLNMESSNWVNYYEFEQTPGERSYHFYAYYNHLIAPNETVQIINTLAPKLQEMLGADLEIYVRADLIAYSGNAYMLKDAGDSLILDSDLPFGILSETFLNTWTAWRQI